jgi:hypothetical protein
MDNREFVPYEIAKELKNMGFDEDCLAFYYYVKMPMLTLCEPELYNKLEKHNLTLLKAPLLGQTFRWFMKKHNLLGIVDYDETDKKFYYYINTMKNDEINWSKNFNFYEEAEFECLKKLIEIVKTEKK